MRKDITIHINTGDMAILNADTSTKYDFQWVENPIGLARYIYGEITVPPYISDNSILSNGLHCIIPYTPQYKEFYIRVKKTYSEDNIVYLTNPVDGSEWFLVKCGLYGSEPRNIFASELLLVAFGNYQIQFKDGIAYIYDGGINDVVISKANHQNANLLVACNPGNNYRYPLSGIGLTRYVNSNITNTDLASVIQREFSSDGVGVKNARYDYESKRLLLDLDTAQVDNENDS